MRRLVPVPLVLLAALAVPTSVLHAQGGAAPPARRSLRGGQEARFPT